MEGMVSEADDATRVDVWLKLVCLVKHRSQATEACQGGHVRINGRRAKPASPIHVGDTVEITRNGIRRLVVLAIPRSSVSKQVAREMYRDESPAPDPALREIERVAPVMDRERGAGRPTKRERRDIEKLRGRRG